MADARARGWGWPDDAGYRSRHIVTITAGGVRLHVRREVAHLFAGFVDGLVAGGYRLDVVADDWGWNNRDIRGRPGVKSNHAWGLAIDVNSTHNPMTEAHPGHAGAPGHDGRGVHTDMPAWVGPLARRWGLTWGANYTGSRKDAMHFEFVGTPQDVARYPLPGTHLPQEPTPRFEEDEDMLIHENCPPGQRIDINIPPIGHNMGGYGRGWASVTTSVPGDHRVLLAVTKQDGRGTRGFPPDGYASPGDGWVAGIPLEEWDRVVVCENDSDDPVGVLVELAR